MDVLLIILWSLVSQQFLILIFDENMRLSFTKYKLKFSSRNLFHFKLMGTFLCLVHIMYFQFIIPFLFIGWLKKGRAGKGCNVNK